MSKKSQNLSRILTPLSQPKISPFSRRYPDITFINQTTIPRNMGKKRLDRDRSILFSKKGQVTIFIILGIILLLVVVLVIMMKREVITFSPEEILPSDKGKVEVYITSCMDKIGNEALTLIGLQAGYVEVPAEIVQDGNSNLRLSPMNVAPYWAYGLENRAPSLGQIKARLDEHIEKNLRTCLMNSTAFQESYNFVEKSALISDTQIAENKIIFSVKWDIELQTKSGERITEIIDHQTDSPVKLKRLYNTAKLIVEKELSTMKLEDITQDLIALEHPNVPAVGIELSCSKKEWDVRKVKETLQTLLRINIKALKVKGTDYVAFPEELTYYQNHYIWDIGEDFKEEEVEVTFNYEPNYPLVFGVTPLQGTKMKTSQLGGNAVLSNLCVQSWKFTYDLVFPVLVQVKDQTTGYVLHVPFTVHLVKNFPNRASTPVARESYLLPKATDEDYCKVKNIPMTVFTYELIENEGGVYNREPLDDANITFSCLRYGCSIGTTEYDFLNRGDVAGLTNYFPYCVGGIVHAEKTGYKGAWERVVTKEGTELELNLVPLYDLPAGKIKVLKHELGSRGLGTGQALSNDEVVSLKITNLRTEAESNISKIFHESSIALAPRLGEQVTGDQNLQFLAKADFTYNVEINLIKGEELIGGYKYNWTVPWDKLETANLITFHVVSHNPGSDAEAFQFILNLEQNSALVSLPEIS